jgi:hypothetical protein
MESSFIRASNRIMLNRSMLAPVRQPPINNNHGDLRVSPKVKVPDCQNGMEYSLPHRTHCSFDPAQTQNHATPYTRVNTILMRSVERWRRSVLLRTSLFLPLLEPDRQAFLIVGSNELSPPSPAAKTVWVATSDLPCVARSKAILWPGQFPQPSDFGNQGLAG